MFTKEENMLVALMLKVKIFKLLTFFNEKISIRELK